MFAKALAICMKNFQHEWEEEGGCVCVCVCVCVFWMGVQIALSCRAHASNETLF